MIRLVILLVALGACTENTDIGGPCSEDQGVVERVLEPARGENRVALDVSFERCLQFLCISVDGHVPYCTGACSSAADCPTDFICEQPIEFGPLSRVCNDDVGGDCEPARYCVRATEWQGLVLVSDAGPEE